MTYLCMIGPSPEKLNVVCLLLPLWLIKSKSFQIYSYWSANFSSSILYGVLSGALSKFGAFEVFEACKMGLCTAMAGPSRKERWATEIVKGRLRNVLTRWDVTCFHLHCYMPRSAAATRLYTLFINGRPAIFSLVTFSKKKNVTWLPGTKKDVILGSFNVFA